MFRLHIPVLYLFQNIGPHFDTWNAGVLGPVTLEGLNEGKRNLSSQKWIYQVPINSSYLLTL